VFISALVSWADIKLPAKKRGMPMARAREHAAGARKQQSPTTWKTAERKAA
jgi:hypothetical protein